MIQPWLQDTWTRLVELGERLPHALLFVGPPGLGKRALVEALAARLLCEAPTADGHACGRCTACQWRLAGNHPDLHHLVPAADLVAEGAESEGADPGAKEGKTKSAQILIEQVRDLQASLSVTGHHSSRRVIVLDPAEAMNVFTANALLKLLEAPPVGCVFLLLSSAPRRLLPTIRSRCVQQACPLPSEAMSLQWLAQALPECGEAERVELLTLAAGSPLAAVKLQAQGVREQRALVVDGVKKLLKQEMSATQLAESAWKDIPLLLLFDWFCDWSSLILRYQLTQDENGLGLADMRKVVQYLAQKSAQDKVLNIQDWILAQRQKVLGKANLNRVLLLEALLVQWVGLLGRR